MCIRIYSADDSIKVLTRFPIFHCENTMCASIFPMKTHSYIPLACLNRKAESENNACILRAVYPANASQSTNSFILTFEMFIYTTIQSLIIPTKSPLYYSKIYRKKKTKMCTFLAFRKKNKNIGVKRNDMGNTDEIVKLL